MKNNSYLTHYVFVLIYSLLIAIPSFSQKRNPPGTIQLNDSLYIDATPKCNLNYREYLWFLRNKLNYNLTAFEQKVSTLPYYHANPYKVYNPANYPVNSDSLTLLISETKGVFWNQWTNFTSYLNGKLYFYFPIVNIPYTVASNFCRWRTQALRVNYAASKNQKERDKYFKEVTYRLPTMGELALAKSKFMNEKAFKFHEQLPHDSLPIFPDFFLLDTSRKFVVTKLHEIATENHLVKQISWDTTSEGSIISTDLPKEAFYENLTFRCVCEVK